MSVIELTPVNEFYSPPTTESSIVRTGVQRVSIVDKSVSLAIAAAEAAELARDEAEAFSNITDFKTITADYTLIAADNGYWIKAEHATTPIAVTIPAGFTGQKPIIIQKQGAADISIDDSLVTVTGDLNITTQYHIIVLVNKGNDLWTAIGGVV